MKTMIAVPCMDVMASEFTFALLNMDTVGDVVYEKEIGSLIYNARNNLLKKAMDEGYDRILWFDSDVIMPPETMRLLSEDLDNGCGIVSGIYKKRKPPFTPTIFSECEIMQIAPDQLLPLHTPYTDYPKDSIFEIAACGFGCVMMDMAAVKQITDKYGKMPFMPVGGFGEDLSFCMRAKKADVKIYCDSRFECGHLGYKVY